MAPLILALSSLEVEAVEIALNAPESEQDSNLNTLSAALGDLEVHTAQTGKGIFTANESCGSAACCCCCCLPCCCG